MGTDQRFSLRWNNYQSHLVTAFESLMEEKDFVDVTLGVEGKKLPAHKMLLSACSPYFRELLKGNPCQHPIIVLRDIKYDDLTSLLQFMYNGEVNVAQEQLNSFLKTAESLKIRGLTDNEEGEPEPPRPPVRDRLADNAPDESPPPPKKLKRPHSDSVPARLPTPPPARLPTPKQLPPPPPRPNTHHLPPQPVKQEIIDIGDEGDMGEDNGYVNDSDRGDDGTVANISSGYDQEEYDETALAVPDGSMDASQGFWSGLLDVGHPLPDGSEIFSCNECGKEFKNEGSLAQHKPIHRINTTCELCGTTLSRVQHYRRHMKTVHNLDPSQVDFSNESFQ